MRGDLFTQMVGAQLGSGVLSAATVVSIILGVGLCVMDNGRPKSAITCLTSNVANVQLGL